MSMKTTTAYMVGGKGSLSPESASETMAGCSAASSQRAQTETKMWAPTCTFASASQGTQTLHHNVKDAAVHCPVPNIHTSLPVHSF